ncbi:MAG: Ran-binding zinc finger domain-containing protein [Bacteroidota bacterium]
MAIYEGRWDCNYCGHTGNKGPSVHCTQCGGPRPKNVQFYLPQDARAVSNESALEAANAGPDWVCSNCASSNKHWDKFCGSCGSPFRSMDGDAILAEKEYDGQAVPRSSHQVVQPVKETRRKGLSNVKRGGIFTIILTAIGTWLGTFNSPSQVEVMGFEWSRTVEIEAYKQVEEEAWSLPSEATLIKQFEAIHHYDKKFKGYETKRRTVREKAGTERYVCGKKDLGNGYFQDKYCTRPVYRERQETYKEKVYEKIPVYRAKYQYSIFKWVDAEPLKTEGKNHAPKWRNDPKLDNPKRFRIKNRSGIYYFDFKDHKGEMHRERVDYEFWERLRFGDTLPAIKSRFYGYFKELDWIKINGQVES